MLFSMFYAFFSHFEPTGASTTEPRRKPWSNAPGSIAIRTAHRRDGAWMARPGQNGRWHDRRHKQERNMKMWYTFHISFYIIFLLLVTIIHIIHIYLCTRRHRVPSETQEHCDWKWIVRWSTASKCSNEVPQTTPSLQASQREPPKPPQPGGGPAGGEATHANPTQR